MKCEFCFSKVEEPVSMDKPTQICPHCQAIYWLESADDLWLAIQEAAVHFGIEPEQMFEQIETKVVRNFDVLKDNKEDGYEEEICLVFAQIKKARIALTQVFVEYLVLIGDEKLTGTDEHQHPPEVKKWMRDVIDLINFEVTEIKRICVFPPQYIRIEFVAVEHRFSVDYDCNEEVFIIRTGKQDQGEVDRVKDISAVAEKIREYLSEEKEKEEED